MKFSGKWDFDPALESIDHISLKDQYGLFINGKFENPRTGNYFPSINLQRRTSLHGCGGRERI